uniref:Uncharacterized protein n=1 Tax=Arundo donax TaxID=35708 RepID=A0A0A9GDE9_ARUDO
MARLDFGIEARCCRAPHRRPRQATLRRSRRRAHPPLLRLPRSSSHRRMEVLKLPGDGGALAGLPAHYCLVRAAAPIHCSPLLPTATPSCSSDSALRGPKSATAAALIRRCAVASIRRCAVASAPRWIRSPPSRRRDAAIRGLPSSFDSTPCSRSTSRGGGRGAPATGSSSDVMYSGS